VPVQAERRDGRLEGGVPIGSGNVASGPSGPEALRFVEGLSGVSGRSDLTSGVADRLRRRLAFLMFANIDLATTAPDAASA